ncbi:ABC transporter ATP-binding protein [Rhizobiaceae bacterium BDR2-2]|uniref:ABC transporter ATP-binding protein n=1 Tax=Ectorhizobium quercum TaxID=2965071 RepID=A0AAE3STI2_9HYPH|nr:ABC transporter ATP-binding protein [Ectorhizobium quercum]MCX8995977.1 ABC transporter ATP-binding protein [Ectorhizobium quercum]
MSAPVHRLSVADYSVGYPGRHVVSGLSLPLVRGGALTALVGPNAAGKTTLLRGLAGLIRSQGSIEVDGRELHGLSASAYARHVTYMPQALPQRVALSVYEAVLSALHATPPEGTSKADLRRRAFETLERLGIGDLALAPLDRLSGGQRQLASLAQAIARQPSVLLLDEPTSALDLRYQLKVMSVVRDLARERGMVTIFVLHDIALAARWCERVIVLSNGRVAADGTPAEAITPAMFAEVYGVEARVERCSHGHVQIMVDGLL